ncbi:hypothetical protein AB205_0128750, partial [Aquarana catesbeiana]
MHRNSPSSGKPAEKTGALKRMESLIRQLLEKAGGEGGEVLLRCCLEFMNSNEEQPCSSRAAVLAMEERREQLRSPRLRGAALAQHERARRSMPPERSRQDAGTAEENRDPSAAEAQVGGVASRSRRSVKKRWTFSLSQASRRGQRDHKSQQASAATRGRMPAQRHTDGPFSSFVTRGGRVWHSMPGTSVGSDLTVADAIKGSVAPKTWYSYMAAWKSWVSFAKSKGFSYNIPSETTILAFLASLMQQQFSSHY